MKSERKNATTDDIVASIEPGVLGVDRPYVLISMVLAVGASARRAVVRRCQVHLLAEDADKLAKEWTRLRALDGFEDRLTEMFARSQQDPSLCADLDRRVGAYLHLCDACWCW